MSTIPHGIISFDDGWRTIKEEGIDIINSPAGELAINQQMRLYTICHDMCTQRRLYNFAGKLYDKYKEIVQDYVNCHVLPLCHSSRNIGSDHFIAELTLTRERYEKVVKQYRSIFRYIDRSYVRHHSLLTLKEVSTRLFEEAVFDYISTHYIPQWKQWINNYSVKKEHTKNLWSIFSLAMEDTRIRNLLVMEVGPVKAFPIPQLFEQARSEETFNHDILHKAFTIRSILKSDNSNLEQELLKSTRKYYTKQREDDSKTMSPSEYMKKAEQTLKDECQLLSKSLSSLSESTAMKMHDITAEELLWKYVENLTTFSEGD